MNFSRCFYTTIGFLLFRKFTIILSDINIYTNQVWISLFGNILLSVSWGPPTIAVMWIQEQCLFLDASILQWGWLRESLLETSGPWLFFCFFPDTLWHVFLSCGMLPCQETGSSSGIFFADSSYSQEMNRYLHWGIVWTVACRLPQGNRTRLYGYVILLSVRMVCCLSPPILHEF